MADARAGRDVSDVPSGGRSALFALGAGSVALVAGGGTLAALYETPALRAASVSAALWGALLLLVLRVPLEALAARVAGPRGRAVWWLSLAVGAVAMGVSLLGDVHHALHATWRFSYGDPRLWECEPWALAVPLMVLIAAGILTRTALPPRAWLRAAAVAAGLAGVALAAGVALRAARAPAIDRYVRSLPVLDRAEAVPGVGPATERSVYTSSRYVDQVAMDGALTLRRYVFEDGRGCAIRARATRDAESLPTVVGWQDERLVGCGPLELRRDARLGVLLVTVLNHWSSETHPFDLRDLRAWTNDRAAYAALAPVAAAPAGWLAAALASLVLGLAAALGRSESRWWRDRRGWRQGALGDDGVIVVDGDGARVGAPFGAALPRGPVVLRALDEGDDGPFRGGVSLGAVAREDARPGTLLSLAADLDARADARLACALFAALVAVAALAPMWAVGLAP